MNGSRAQLRVLYRQFLFRIVDVEVLAPQAQGDANRLLGQFAALLVFISVSLSLPAIFSGGAAGNRAGAETVGTMWITQHFLIATTMLVVGLFAVLSWDAIFPDRRDVMVLAPLPVRAPAMFLAKVAAVASALGLTILLLHSVMGLLWPLSFAARARPATLPRLTLETTTAAPVAARDLQAVMDRALRQALSAGGSLAPGTGAGLAIGVWKQGERRLFAYGAARPDSLFEIGSISKTFTGLMLARMEAEGKVRFDEPVRELLPAGTVARPAASGAEITLLDLATHRSGLPRMPRNFRPANRANPYADYGPRHLYDYLARRGVARAPNSGYLYSNLGLGLLGQALAVRAGKSYAAQLQDQVTGPLAMDDTVVTLSDEQQRRFLQGHDAEHHPVQAWDLDGLAGAGAIRSTAADMLTYLEANLHPERHPALAGALASSHRLRADAGGGALIALAWSYDPSHGAYRHGGATAGFTSHAFFNPQTDTAAIVLMNTGPSLLLSPGLIAEHIRQRLRGEPAISLETVVVPSQGGFTGALRSFAAYWLTMFAAGLFVFGAVLGLQGLAAQVLPRRLFLRSSGHLQLAAFCLIVCVYFLQPGLGGLADLGAASIWRVMLWLPSYWFLGFYQQVNGSMHPALEPLARRAWLGLAIVLCVAAAAYALSYWRTLRKIVEEPDIVAGVQGRRWLGWLPRFGNEAQTAIGQFSIRTLARSRQHRMILAFYLGIGLAFTSLLLKDPATKRQFTDAVEAANPWREASVALWAASLIMMALAVVGTRVVFALPLDPRANWVFRAAGVRGGRENLAAARHALLLLAVAPVWLVEAAICFGLWPGWESAVHLAALALVGLILTELCLLGFRKIPFACSYLPGRSRFHLVFLGAIGLLLGCVKAALYERELMREDAGAGGVALMLAVLAGAWLLARWRSTALAAEQAELRFEDEDAPAVQGLGLDRDGVIAGSR